MRRGLCPFTTRAPQRRSCAKDRPHPTYPHRPHPQPRSDDPHQAERDRDARQAAAAQAEARQKQFEQSAVGRAALKSVQNAKKVEQRQTAGASAQDWLS